MRPEELNRRILKLVEALETGLIRVKHVPKRLRDNLARVIDNLESPRAHTWEQRDDDLASCTVCCGGEASLPTHCPGKPMSAAIVDDVIAGRLDFKDGKWDRTFRDADLLAVAFPPGLQRDRVKRPASGVVGGVVQDTKRTPPKEAPAASGRQVLPIDKWW